MLRTILLFIFLLQQATESTATVDVPSAPHKMCSQYGGYDIQLGYLVRASKSPTRVGNQQCWERSVQDIVIVTHMTLDRTSRLIELCHSYKGPISASVYFHQMDLPRSTTKDGQLWHKLASDECVRSFVSVHVVYFNASAGAASLGSNWAGVKRTLDFSVLYPFNVMRNVALEGASYSYGPCSHVMLLDIDLRLGPSASAMDTHSQLVKHFDRHRRTFEATDALQGAPYSTFAVMPPAKKKVAWVIPTVETRPSAFRLIPDPATMEDFGRAVKAKAVRPFYHRQCPLCYGALNLTHFAEATDPFVFASAGTDDEPFVIIPSRSVPQLPAYEEAIVGRGKDKQSFFISLHLLGWRTVVLPKVFLLNRGAGDEPFDPEKKRNTDERGRTTLMTERIARDAANRVVFGNVIAQYQRMAMAIVEQDRLGAARHQLAAALNGALKKLLAAWTSFGFGTHFCCVVSTRTITEPSERNALARSARAICGTGTVDCSPVNSTAGVRGLLEDGNGQLKVDWLVDRFYRTQMTQQGVNDAKNICLPNAHGLFPTIEEGFYLELVACEDHCAACVPYAGQPVARLEEELQRYVCPRLGAAVCQRIIRPAAQRFLQRYQKVHAPKSSKATATLTARLELALGLSMMYQMYRGVQRDPSIDWCRDRDMAYKVSCDHFSKVMFEL